MKHPLSIVAALSALTATACLASLPKARQDYIESRPHGWIELTVSHAGVPARVDSTDGSQFRPGECDIGLSLDGEEFLMGAVHPKGTVEPYTAETGFRFAAPEGTYTASLHYSGCTENGEVRFDTALRVSPDTVTELLFDGHSVTVLPQRPDTKVTLEDVYEAVVEGRR